MYVGVKAILAKSFERIHAANLINFGILPLTFLNEGDYDRLADGDRLLLPDIRSSLVDGDRVRLLNDTRGISMDVAFELSRRQKNILLAGGVLNRF